MRLRIVGLSLGLATAGCAPESDNIGVQTSQFSEEHLLFGHVKDADGNPASGVMVRIKDSDSLIAESVFTDADGFYQLQQATFASPKRKSIQAYQDFIAGGGDISKIPTPFFRAVVSIGTARAASSLEMISPVWIARAGFGRPPFGECTAIWVTPTLT